MKNILYTLIGLLSVTLTSCEKFLDLKPTDALIADNAVYDAKTANALVNSAYTSLKRYYVGSDILLGVLPADNIFFGGSQSQNIELDNNAFTVTNSAIVNAYRANYTLINITNWAISEIPKVEDQKFKLGEKQKLIGEAYAIRALAYFNLVRSWGGVQLQLNPTKDLTTLGNIKRSSAAQTYAQIISDLNQAEQLLPQDDAYTRNLLQRAAIQGLRAKVKLYARQFDEIEVDADALINNPKYELVKQFKDFYQPPFLSKESVFELSATANNPGVSANSWLPASGTPRGTYEFRPTNELIGLLNNSAIGGDRNALLAKRENDVYGVLYHTTSPNLNSAYVLRIADIYLIRAEARLRKSSPDILGAISDLNTIRRRSNASLFPEENAVISEVLQAIWDERRVEFALEGDRWYDLVRTEQAEKVLGIQENLWLFPIPQADVLADKDLDDSNNPGY